MAARIVGCPILSTVLAERVGSRFTPVLPPILYRPASHSRERHLCSIPRVQRDESPDWLLSYLSACRPDGLTQNGVTAATERQLDTPGSVWEPGSWGCLFRWNPTSPPSVSPPCHPDRSNPSFSSHLTSCEMVGLRSGGTSLLFPWLDEWLGGSALPCHPDRTPTARAPRAMRISNPNPFRINTYRNTHKC
jgi:hypothetical protein